jgi:hypothetical protein
MPLAKKDKPTTPAVNKKKDYPSLPTAVKYI